MKASRFTEEKIIAILAEQERGLATANHYFSFFFFFSDFPLRP